MNRSLRYVKFLIVTILIGLFAWNSLYLFKYFIVGKKVTSYEDKNNPVLLPPAIFVCRRIAFTKAKDMAKLDDFLENTLYLNYSVYYALERDFVTLKNHGTKNRPTYEISNVTIINASRSEYEKYFKIEHIYSFSRGLCYKFQFMLEVRPYDLVGLYIYPNEGKDNEDLEVYITESGEEYYVHIYIWRIMPFHFKLDAEMEVVDLAVKKIVSYEDENCNARDDYDYIACLKSDYKDHCIPGTEHYTTWYGLVSYPNCTMPWQQSMLDNHWSPSYDQNEVSICNDTELNHLYSLDYEYLKVAARLRNENCQAPCKVVKYQADKFQMIQNPQDIWRERKKTNHTSFTRYITMYYPSSDVATLTEEKLIDFSNFVSAVGGNLGLFLGFSFLGLLSSLYEYIETVLSSRQKDNDENNEMIL